MATRVDSASKLIRASASTIYRAFAEPGALERWLPPQGMSGRMLRFEFYEGGAYRMRLEYQDARNRGKTSENADEVEVRIVSLVPDQRIEQVVTFESDDPEFAEEMRITWTLDNAKEGTLVTVRCEDVPLGIRPEDHEAGLKSSLANLATFAEHQADDPQQSLREGR